MKQRIRSVEWASQIGIFVLVVFILSIAREVFIPLALSILFTFLLHPVVVRLQRWRFGRIPSVLIVSLLAITSTALVVYHLGAEMASFAQELPKYKTELSVKLKELSGTGANLGGMWLSFRREMKDAMVTVEQEAEDKEAKDDTLANVQGEMENASALETQGFGSKSLQQGLDAEAAPQESLGKSAENPLFVKAVKDDPAGDWWNWLLSASSLLAPIGTSGLVLVFTLFLLIYQGDLRDRFIKLVSGGQFVTTTQALNEAGQRISRYLFAQTIVNGSYGLVVSLGLWLIGLTMTEEGFPNLLLWGALCSILRFVPYAGPVIAGVFPISIALAVFPGFQVFLAVLTLIILLELISNNALEPWLYGSSTGISAVAVIFASVFWGWLWGPVGLLLATPLTVCLVVLGKHVPPFRIFQTMLGEGEAMSLPLRLYQRLLAKDSHQAASISKERIVEKDVNHFLDSMIVPVLRRMRKDRKYGRLKAEDEQEMVQAVFKILDECSTPEKEVPENTQAFTVVAIPARSEVEQRLLETGLRSWHGNAYGIEIESYRTRPSQLVEKLKLSQPEIVVIGMLAPGIATQVEYLSSRIRRALPETKIVLNYMGRPRQFDHFFQRMRSAGTDFVATSFVQTENYVDMFAGDVLPAPQQQAVVPASK